jgi:uncharacterized protein YcgL (UPF0745 family)
MIRTKKEVQASLLRRAFKENRGAEMLLTLQWLKARLRHETSGVSEALKKFDNANFGQPKSVRMLNVLAERYGASRDGEEVRFGDDSIKPNAPGSSALN